MMGANRVAIVVLLVCSSYLQLTRYGVINYQRKIDKPRSGSVYFLETGLVRYPLYFSARQAIDKIRIGYVTGLNRRGQV